MATVPTTNSLYTQVNGLSQPTPRFVNPVTPAVGGPQAGVPVGDASKANANTGDLVTAGIAFSAPIANGVAPGNQTNGVMPVQAVAFTIIDKAGR